MIALFLAVQRLPNLTAAAFQAHWRDIHRPLVLKHADTLRIRSYVQIAPLSEVTLQARGARSSALWDGLAILTYDAKDAHARPHETEAGRAAVTEIRRDERTFINTAATVSWWGAPIDADHLFE